jgi:hypothetical protein
MNLEVARRYQEVHETLDDGRAASYLGFSVYSLHGLIRKQHAALETQPTPYPCMKSLGSPLTDKSSFPSSSIPITPSQWSCFFTIPQSNVAIESLSALVANIQQDERTCSSIVNISGSIEQSLFICGYGVVDQLQYVS